MSYRPTLAPGATLGRLDSAVEGGDFVLQSPNGRYWRVSRELYVLGGLLDGTRTLDQLATDWGQALDRNVSVEQTEHAIETAFAARDLIGTENAGEVKPTRRRGPLLWSVPLIGETVINAVSRRLLWLFHPLVVRLLVGAVIVQRVYMYIIAPPVLTQFGAANGALVFGLTLASVMVHEFGHASAAVRYGQRCPTIGFGMYFFVPVFYSDVTAAWLLPRMQRVVVDIAGAYFKMVFSLLCYAWFVFRPDPALIVAVLAMDAMTLFSLNPFLKYDGYWLVSDSLGVPNLHRVAFAELNRAVRKVGTASPYSLVIRRFLLLYGVCYLSFFGYFLGGFFLRVPGSLFSVIRLAQDMAAGQPVSAGKMFMSVASTVFLLTIALLIGKRVWQLIRSIFSSGPAAGGDTRGS